MDKKKNKNMKNKTIYRVDSILNNERLHIDIRDDISLLQALLADRNLKLDYYTMYFLISLRRSILTTYENVGEDIIKIPSNSLYKLKERILNDDFDEDINLLKPDIRLVEESLEEEKIEDIEEIDSSDE